MNRRAFLSALGLAGVPASIAAIPATKPAPPVARSAAHCPACGDQMFAVKIEKQHRNDPDVWSCGRCERSWSIPFQPLPSIEVPYDSGMPQRSDVLYGTTPLNLAYAERWIDYDDGDAS